MFLNAPAIHLENVSVVRWGHPILANVSLRVAPGGGCAILGPNGSGKSTLLAVLSGYVWPTSGTVCIGGQRYGEVELTLVRRTIGMIEPSRSPAFDERMSVRDVVATGLSGTIRMPLHEEISSESWRRVENEVRLFGLDGLEDDALSQLSTGEQMKALLARAMIGKPRLLLLDEPTAGLDMGARAVCVGALDRLLNRPRHPTVVLISHHLDELPRSVDQVVLLKHGGVFGDGSPDAMLTSERLSRLLDCRVEVFKSNGRYVASVQEM
ncbi:MAG: ATP-binding cassette domain-containing protein [Phycisphaerae bacterium]|nr:ATP-binding cassette domain-containing protein [Phycisphaerae bacterium]